MTHTTQDQAFKALCDPAIPIPDALKLFKKAYRRSNDVTKGFVLHTAGIFRQENERREGKS